MRDPLLPIPVRAEPMFAVPPPARDAPSSSQLCVLRSVRGMWALMRVQRIQQDISGRGYANVEVVDLGQAMGAASRAKANRLMHAVIQGFDGSLLTHVGVCLLGRAAVSDLVRAIMGAKTARIPGVLFFLEDGGGVGRRDGTLATTRNGDPSRLVVHF